MSRRRRGFLGRDDVIGTPRDTLETGLPTPYVPPEPKKQVEVDEDPISETDLGFDLQLPESMDEQIPGFFDWDGGDGLEEPPTEEVPSLAIDSWSEDFSAPLGVPEAPPMEGILDGLTPAPVPFTEDGEYESFDALFDAPKKAKTPLSVGGLHVGQLILFLVAAIIFGLVVSVPLAIYLYVNPFTGETVTFEAPITIPLKKEIRVRSKQELPIKTKKGELPSAAATRRVNMPQSKSPSAATSDGALGTVRVRLRDAKYEVVIWIDGDQYGSPPINVALSSGSHSIAAIPIGREDLKKEVDIQILQGKTNTVDFGF